MKSSLFNTCKISVVDRNRYRTKIDSFTIKYCEMPKIVSPTIFLLCISESVDIIQRILVD